MPSAWLELDTDLRKQLRHVLEEPRPPVTEAELRKLTDEGRACKMILGGELERLERRLGKVDSDPNSSLVEVADAFRRAHELRTHVEELDALMAALDTRAREARSSWGLRTTGRPR